MRECQNNQQWARFVPTAWSGSRRAVCNSCRIRSASCNSYRISIVMIMNQSKIGSQTCDAPRLMNLEYILRAESVLCISSVHWKALYWLTSSRNNSGASESSWCDLQKCRKTSNIWESPRISSSEREGRNERWRSVFDGSRLWFFIFCLFISIDVI